MAKTIMIQGTSSSAGKSLLVTGLCRVLRQDGIRVAPFKSQNMALNAYVTPDGLEMGGAQAVQAEAAGIPPDPRMNPILLKPTGENGSRVIVHGRDTGFASAREYFLNREQRVPDVTRAFESLSAEYDAVVIEGAGSPAEINLKAGDIANMGMARLADAPVLLVGDIDRGGVFASLAGTLLWLDDEERARVKGMVINKFRGDVTLLTPGLEMLEAKTGIMVLGVLPWLDVRIDEEDSLGDSLSRRVDSPLDIAVIRLPYMADFAGFTSLRDFGLRYTDDARSLGSADLVILPPCSNASLSAQWLQQSGLAAAIQAHAAAGRPVLGICGGYRILGQRVAGNGSETPGLGLLQETPLGTQRSARRQGVLPDITGVFSRLSGLPFTGHLEGEGAALACEGNVHGTNLQGFFAQPGVAAALVSALLQAKGLGDTPVTIPDAAFRERQYDVLADAVRAALDMRAIYRIMGL